MARRIEDVHNDLQEHKEEDSMFHGEIRQDIKVIKENHLAHIQASMTQLEVNYAWLKYLALAILALLIKLAFFK